MSPAAGEQGGAVRDELAALRIDRSRGGAARAAAVARLVLLAAIALVVRCSALRSPGA